MRTIAPVNDPTLEWQVVKPADDDAPLRGAGRAGHRRRRPRRDRRHCAGAIATEVGVEADVEVVERGTLERHGYKQVRLVDH